MDRRKNPLHNMNHDKASRVNFQKYFFFFFSSLLTFLFPDIHDFFFLIFCKLEKSNCNYIIHFNNNDNFITIITAKKIHHR